MKLPFVSTLALICAVVLWTTAILQWDDRSHSLQSFSHNNHSAKIEFESLSPTISQESIEQALTKFSIQVPSRIVGPLLDRELLDRGLTSRNTILSPPKVRIGPSAFTSWALLGSTLAHEIEVHCKQSFVRIVFEEKFGFSGQLRAEREAYSYELVNFQRFGLSPMERRHILDTMDRYYPIDGVRPNPTLNAMRLGLSSLLRK